jgi:murein peptide amidase A
VSELNQAVELSGPPELRRLGKNRNGYLGETIDLEAVLADCLAAARAHGWAIEEILPAPRRLLGLTRSASARGASPLRVYLSTGIHGDEPAGPLAVRRLLHEDQWPPEVSLWLCPSLNPGGFRLQRRENPEGLDLNRQYLHPQAAETLAHTAWLLRQPAFDLCLCLHEDWESHGFYIYELNPDNQPSLAQAMIEQVAKVCPIDCSDTIEGRPACKGLIRPSVDPRSRPDWPEAFFLLTHKTRLSYTLEAPSDFPLSARVAALVVGVNTALGLAQACVAERDRPVG